MKRYKSFTIGERASYTSDGFQKRGFVLSGWLAKGFYKTPHYGMSLFKWLNLPVETPFRRGFTENMEGFTYGSTHRNRGLYSVKCSKTLPYRVKAFDPAINNIKRKELGLLTVELLENS